MNVLVKTLGFSVTLLFVFMGITYLLPQTEGEAPKETTIDLGSLTMDTFVKLGDDLFHGKGACTLCHNSLGRAPDLLALNAVDAAGKHLADSRYKGKAKDAESYLRESMLDPSIYVVAGFGKKGSNDTESPMPTADKPPTLLSTTEIDAIIAFLQSKDGNPVTVALPTEAPVQKEVPAAPVLAQSPEEALNKFGCTACHAILESQAPVGPDLNNVGSRLSVENIRQSIIDPNAVITKGYTPMMPDLSEKMSVKELEMMVKFLADKKG
ncbi:hypothetical protein MNBD_GAMMA21-1954 [hydrothermal vent metagenome]|uniref:Cytochrome c domain-containing protein n=1 Tax=hydrothermal vent metagenome TaxID=652676 RepID=A0A3B1ACZ9_9ZZZZ